MQSAGMTTHPPLSRQPSRLPVNRHVLWTVVVILLAGVAYALYSILRPAPSTVSPAVTVPAQVGSITAVVNSTGQVAPWTQAKLTFRTSGRLASLLVRVGDVVHRGDVLASLDGTDLQIQVDQAQANLASAEAKLEAIQAGARPEEVAAAEAAYAAAQARLDGMLAGGRPEDVKAAEAALAAAQAKLHALRSGSLPSDLAAAQAAVDQATTTLANARAALANLQRPPDPLALQAAQLAVEQAKDTLWSAQTTRDGSCSPRNPQYVCDAANATVAADQVALQQAQLKLAQLQEPPKAEDLAAARAAVASAQSQLDSARVRLAQLQAAPASDDVIQAEAAVIQAQQALDLKKRPYSDAEIAQQRDAVAQAKAQLDLKRAPYTPADLDAAKAAVAQARAQLALAQYNLDSATLRAPFDGIVSAVNANVGEMVSASSAGPIVALVDPNNLRLDVSVDETDVAHVEVGYDATVTFDALPGRAFTGKVVAIAPSASVQQGVATYQVTISLKDAVGVKPGMTGNANIVYAHHENVLTVPNRAVRTEGDRRVVTVLEGGKLIAHSVAVGVSDERSTEILNGLKAGDQVVIPMTASVLPGFAGGPRR